MNSGDIHQLQRALAQSVRDHWVLFLIEGIVQGFAGGIVAAGIMYYAITYGAPYVSAELVAFTVVDNMFYALVVVVGVSLGLLGSAISVGRFIGEDAGSGAAR